MASGSVDSTTSGQSILNVPRISHKKSDYQLETYAPSMT